MLHREEGLQVRFVHLDHESLQEKVVSRGQVIVTIIPYRLNETFCIETKLLLQLLHYLHIHRVKVSLGAEALSLWLMQTVPRMLSDLVHAYPKVGIGDEEAREEVFRLSGKELG